MSNFLLEAKLWTRHQPPRRNLNQQGDDHAEIVSVLITLEGAVSGTARAERWEAGEAPTRFYSGPSHKMRQRYLAGRPMIETESACPGNSALCWSWPRMRAGEVLLRILPKKRQRYLAARLFEKALLWEKAQILCCRKAPLLEKALSCSVAEPGCLSRIPAPDFFTSRIPDLGSRIQKTPKQRREKNKICCLTCFRSKLKIINLF